MSAPFHFVPYLLYRRGIEAPDPWVLLGRSSESHVARIYPGEPQVYPSDMFAGKFWFIGLSVAAMDYPPFQPAGSPTPQAEMKAGTHQTASTEEIGTILEQGFPVGVISGPFDTRDQAHYSLDLFWECGD
jgi:hypothetical protein